MADRGVFDRGLELRLHLCGSCVTDSTSGPVQDVIISCPPTWLMFQSSPHAQAGPRTYTHFTLTWPLLRR